MKPGIQVGAEVIDLSNAQVHSYQVEGPERISSDSKGQALTTGCIVSQHGT